MFGYPLIWQFGAISLGRDTIYLYECGLEVFLFDV